MRESCGKRGAERPSECPEWLQELLEKYENWGYHHFPLWTVPGRIYSTIIAEVAKYD